jgi:hypothetical protein
VTDFFGSVRRVDVTAPAVNLTAAAVNLTNAAVNLTNAAVNLTAAAVNLTGAAPPVIRLLPDAKQLPASDGNRQTVMSGESGTFRYMDAFPIDTLLKTA